MKPIINLLRPNRKRRRKSKASQAPIPQPRVKMIHADAAELLTLIGDCPPEDEPSMVEENTRFGVMLFNRKDPTP